MIVLSADPVTMLPDFKVIAAQTAASCPTSLLATEPFDICHTMAVLSQLPLNSRLASAPALRQLTVCSMEFLA